MTEASKSALAKLKNLTVPTEKVPDATNVDLVKPLQDASDDEPDAPLQAEKIKAEVNLNEKPKQKRNARKGDDRTERQKEATRKMKEALALKQQQKKEQKALEEEQRKKELEEKVLKKAISIKKKQIKEQLALDEISDDDTPIEELLPPKRKTPVARKTMSAPAPPPAVTAPPKQKIIFM